MIYTLFRYIFMSIIATAIPFLAAVSSVACTSTSVPNDAQVDETAYGWFKTAVASVPNRQFQVYWLGREFTAGGVVFRGPGWGPMGGIADLDRMSMDYEGRLEGGGLSLTIRLYTRNAWATAQPTIEHPSAGEPERRTVVVGGRPGELLTGSLPGRPINYQQVIVDFGETVVTAVAGSGGSATPGGPDVNPLIDEQTFLSVMQQLRPYPQ